MSRDATRWTGGCQTGDLSFRSIIEEMMIEWRCKNNVCELTLVVMEGAFCLPAPARVVGGLRRREHGRNYNHPVYSWKVRRAGPATLTDNSMGRM